MPQISKKQLATLKADLARAKWLKENAEARLEDVLRDCVSLKQQNKELEESERSLAWARRLWGSWIQLDRSEPVSVARFPNEEFNQLFDLLSRQ